MSRKGILPLCSTKYLLRKELLHLEKNVYIWKQLSPLGYKANINKNGKTTWMKQHEPKKRAKEMHHTSFCC